MGNGPVEHSSTQNVGGKGGGGSGDVTNYTYSSSFACLVCEGPAEIRRIWFNDQIVYDNGDTKLTIECYAGDEDQLPDPMMQSYLAAQGKPCPAHRGSCFFTVDSADVTPYGSRMPNVQIEVYKTFEGGAAGIIKDIARMVGVADLELDVDSADDEVLGFCNTGRQGAKDALSPLITVIGGDIVEVDGQLRYVRRGGSPYRTLNDDDLGVVLWDKGPGEQANRIASTRGQAMELPIRLDVEYIQWNDIIGARNYLQGSQHATRHSKVSLQEAQTMTFPVVMKDDQAIRLARRLLYTMWAEIDQYTVVVGQRNLDLAPGDIIMVPHGDKMRRVRISSMDMSLPGQIEMQIARDDWSVMHQYAVAPQTGGQGVPSIVDYTMSEWAWQTNSFSDTIGKEDKLHLWFAASGQQGWGGATIYGSTDGGGSYQAWCGKSYATVMGVTQTTLGVWSDYSTMDTTNSVDISISRGALLSCSSAELLNGTNAIQIGDEILQFQTSTSLGGNVYRLTNLLRGQRGTDPYMNSHATGDLAAVIDGHLQIKTFDTDMLGATVMVKFVQVGSSLASATTHTLTLNGPEFKPWSVASVSGTRTLGDLDVIWTPRPRYSGTPIPDTPASYDVEIWNSSFTSLKRTFSSLSSAAATYTSAQQVVDFGSPQATVYARIYQIGDLVGRGHKWEGAL